MNKFITFIVCLLSGMGLVLLFGCLASPTKTWDRLKSVGRGLRNSAAYRFVLVGGMIATFVAAIITPVLGVTVSAGVSVMLLYGMKSVQEKKAPAPKEEPERFTAAEMRQMVQEAVKETLAGLPKAPKKAPN